MTMFSSRPPFQKKVWDLDWTYYLFPHPQHNPTNRMLTAARRALADGHLADFCEGFLKQRNTEHAEIDHAQRVLQRLANLTKEN